ncbi:MAG: acetate--CoA ligase [Methanobacteriota archaeon]
MPAPDIESVLHESRSFPPPDDFARRAKLSATTYADLRARAARDPEAFWAEAAADLEWARRWDRTLEWKPPFAKWFVGGRLNVAANCVDRHLASGRRDKAAIIWEGEPGDTRTLTYQALASEVARFANGLRAQGIREGDRVGIYMPLIPEAVVAMLACARIGAPHSVVFGGFSAEAVKDRMSDARARAIVTANVGYRKGAPVPLKANVDEAVKAAPTVETVIVAERDGTEVPMTKGRDVLWSDVVRGQKTTAEAPPHDSEHPLFVLYTSGSTGKPKGVLHTGGGYLTGVAATTKWIFDLREEDTYWCTADIGWVTGHSYVVYGPLANGATVFLYEGAPTTPQPDRWWDMIERHRVSILYTAPTAIRAFMRLGEPHPAAHDLSSLRLLGTVGEPINPEAWMWYRRVIGGDRCPIVDTWWQTETGAILISPMPGATTTKPGTATLPFPGIDAAVVDQEGREVGPDQGGFLVIRKPWPSMLRTIYGDPDRYVQQYWSRFPGVYFTVDGARRDKDGYFWIMGRIDDVIKVSGHRLGTMEVESALVSHKHVAEAAVIGRPDDVTGEAIVAFVTVKKGVPTSHALVDELKAHVVKEVGALARPAEVRFTEALPKTRSGKIMRRLLREVASGGRVKGDVTTLEDFSVLEALRGSEEE